MNKAVFLDADGVLNEAIIKDITNYNLVGGIFQLTTKVVKKIRGLLH